MRATTEQTNTIVVLAVYNTSPPSEMTHASKGPFGNHRQRVLKSRPGSDPHIVLPPYMPLREGSNQFEYLKGRKNPGP